MIKTVKYVPLEAVLRPIYNLIEESNIDYNTVLDWAYDAMEALEVRYTYQEAIEFVQVVNHRAQVPIGLKYVEQILYKIDLDNDEEETILRIIRQDQSGNNETPSTTADEFYLSASHSASWAPLRLASSIWARSVHCAVSPNIYASCEHEYTIDPNGCITTSFENGFLAIAFLSHPKNEEGQFLVPDERDYRQAVENYIFFKYWLQRFNMKEEGAERRMVYYQQQWDIFAAKVTGDLMIFSLDGLQNFQDQMLRIGPHTDSYDTGYGNLGRRERLRFHN